MYKPTATLLIVTACIFFGMAASASASTHPADSNADWSIGDPEILSYTSSWRSGSVADNYFLNAIALWRAGAYHYDTTCANCNIAPNWWVVGAATAPATGSYIWSKPFGGSSIDAIAATAVDRRANCDGLGGTNCIVVTGRFAGTVDFGGGPLTSAGQDDVFLAKYTSSGAHVWSKRLGGTGTERGQGVGVDTNGNILLAAVSLATANFGGADLPGAGGADIVLAKYAGSDGAHIWSKRIGGTSADWPYGMAVDTSSNCDTLGGTNCLVVTGSFAPPVDFDGGPLTNPSGQVTDTYVAKYSSTGTYLWAKNFTNSSESSGKAVAVDATGNVALTGYYKSSMNMGGSDLPSGGFDGNIFVAKLSSAGAHLWSKGLGNPDYKDVGNAITYDASGNVVLAGTTAGGADFGGGTIVADTFGNLIVAKYTTGGAHMWSRGGGGASYDIGTGVTTDGSSNVIVTGSFRGTADFGGTSLTSLGGQDIYVAKYAAATGAHLWSKGYGGSLDDLGQAVTTDAASNVIAGGYFQDVVNFGGGSLTSAGSFDAFLLKLTP